MAKLFSGCIVKNPLIGHLWDLEVVLYSEMIPILYLFTQLEGGLLFIKINLQTRLLIVTRLVNEADIVNKTRPLFTLSLEMTRLVNETRLLLVPSVNSDVNSDIYGMCTRVCPLLGG